MCNSTFQCDIPFENFLLWAFVCVNSDLPKKIGMLEFWNVKDILVWDVENVGALSHKHDMKRHGLLPHCKFLSLVLRSSGLLLWKCASVMIFFLAILLYIWSSLSSEDLNTLRSNNSSFDNWPVLLIMFS